ncbi:hypothetical protein NDU88_004092 [Pleurodeles waltl]|uniref:Uncharacterized protein n=1 Tax=Pleurodeles waltl TaxID=8319 RepID=A0AAV7M912_PLEWA|nr:hypothetical protein NDU88_004092 [Pleurodeles waltl]
MESRSCLMLVLGVASVSRSAPAPYISRDALADVPTGLHNSPMDEADLPVLNEGDPVHTQLPQGNRAINEIGEPNGESVVLYRRNNHVTKKKPRRRPGAFSFLSRFEDTANWLPEIDATQMSFAYDHPLQTT